jgi:predicted amidohydrolase
LSAIAAECGLWLHAGSVQLAAADASDSRRANASLVFSPDGGLAARYDKVHLFEAALADGESWREADVYAPGDRLVTVTTPLGLLGLATCYDVRFPAVFNAYSSVPVDAIAVPAAFTAQTGRAHWHVLLRARAIETQAFVIAAAQVGEHDDGRQTYGHSLVVDPWGSLLLDMEEDIGLGFCDIDLTQLRHTRRQIPALANKVKFLGPSVED